MDEKKENENVTLVELKNLESSSDKLARELRMLSRAFKKLSASGLKRKTIILLINDSSKVSKGDIDCVLTALENLEKDYLKEEKI